MIRWSTHRLHMHGTCLVWYLNGCLNRGVDAIYKANLAKAELLYGYIDSSVFYANPIAKANRSIT